MVYLVNLPLFADNHAIRHATKLLWWYHVLIHGFQIYFYRCKNTSDEDVYTEKQARKAASTIKIPTDYLSYTKSQTSQYALYVIFLGDHFRASFIEPYSD